MNQFPPTRAEALKRLQDVSPNEYAENRNHVSGGTQLSPYITRGVLTLPEVRDEVLSKYSDGESSKLVFELAWREYFQREWKIRGDAIFKDIKRQQEPIFSKLTPCAVINAQTGIETLDQSIHHLKTTGYMRNHARMWVAGLVCNIAQTHWQEPSKWLYYHLLDGDVASNTLSWQWVAGTFSSKKYLPAQENINMFSGSKQKNTYLDAPYYALAEMDVPELFNERSEMQLSWTAPEVTPVSIDDSKQILLYHPWWLNQQWRKNEEANRILVLDPEWFKQWPVNENVTQFILDLANEIDGIQIHVGSAADFNSHNKIISMEHPSTKDWPGGKDSMELLFPDVPLKSFNSFMSFWKACQKSIKQDWE